MCYGIISITNLTFLKWKASLVVYEYMLAQLDPKVYKQQRVQISELVQPLVLLMLFICKYPQTYNVYSEIWGGVKNKTKQKKHNINKKCVLFIQTKTILLNRPEKSVIRQKWVWISFLCCFVFIIFYLLMFDYLGSHEDAYCSHQPLKNVKS